MLRADAASWSVAECLDDLGTANRVYLGAMQPFAARALRDGRKRRGPAQPGLIGGWFVKYLEPPVKAPLKSKAPRAIRPRAAPALHDAITSFLESQEQVRTFLRTCAGIDLTGVRFPNQFIPGVESVLRPGWTASPRRAPSFVAGRAGTSGGRALLSRCLSGSCP